MKTDSLFYNLFREFPGIFFELIGQPDSEAESYRFTSVEVKQLAFRLDGLFLPTNTESLKPFYVVEVQFQADEYLYSRIFSELFLYIKQYKPLHPWHVVVIYPLRSVEREEPLQFAEILSLDRVSRIYLDELEQEAEDSLGIGVVKLVIAKQKVAIDRAKILINRAEEQLNDDKVKRNLIDLIETIIVYKLPKKSRKEIERMLNLSELKNTKVYQEALEEGRQEGRQEGLQEGLQEGRQEGLQEGRLQGRLETISKMQQLGITKENIAQVLELNLDLVELACLSTAVKIGGFLQLLENPESKFYVKQLESLRQLLIPLEDNLEKLSLFIFVWLENQPKLKLAYHKVLKNISTSPEEREREQLSKALLLEAIQRFLSTD